MESIQRPKEPFIPAVWAGEVRKFNKLKKKYNIQPGEISWLLDHWYWPFTEHEVAKWLTK